MRVNDRSNHVSTSVDVAVWLECTMNRISDGDRSTSLSFLSCGALQSDEIIGILKVLFRYVGIGTRLAMCNVIWMEARSWCPTRSLLRRGRASFCDICQHTSSRSLFAGRWPVSALPPAKRARKAEHVPFASRERQLYEVPMLSMCLFLCYTPITSPSAADSFYFLKLLGTG